MKIEQARVLEHRLYGGEYRMLVLAAPAAAASVRPGQFIHLRVPRLDSAVLRRPFSVFGAARDGVSILYKPIGRGTRAMTSLEPGDEISVIGPLGNGFPRPDVALTTVAVAGGYGVAPLLFLARESKTRGLVFLGGAAAGDILCVDEFTELGWEVRAATEDGSMGVKGLVTSALDEWIGGLNADTPQLELFACGPEGMLRAVGERAIAHGWRGWLSLDRRMGCGVGACLVCVQRVQSADGKVKWARVCRDGPVFEARQIVWD
jgi:dihydroorotate dehydrogenase electron transfer subunit